MAAMVLANRDQQGEVAMLCVKLAALAGALFVAAAPIAAASTTFSGSGVLETQGGKLPATGLTPVGSAFTFSFDFDFAAAVPYEESVEESIYDLTVTNFSATLGGYSLSLASEPLYVPFVLISRDFTFFDEQFSEPALIYSFYFSSALTGSGSPATPFQLASGSRIFLQIAALFKAGGDQGMLGLDRVVDPAGAFDRSFVYSARDASTRKSGFVQGSYGGRFTTAAAVPEVSTWTMMIAGFGATGTVLRRRAKPAVIVQRT